MMAGAVSRQLKIALVAAVLLVALAALALLLLSRVDARSRFESVASQATGLQVAVGGDASLGLLPTPHVTLTEVVLKSGASRVASIGEVDIGLSWWSLLRRQDRIERLTLREVELEIERDRNGQLASGLSSQAARRIPALSLERLSLFKASFRYLNRQSGKAFAAEDCSGDVGNVELADASAAEIMKHLSLAAHLECAEVRNSQFSGANAHFSIVGEHGVVRFKPLTMQILGGQGDGTIDADFTGRTPMYRVHFVVSQLQAASLFRSLASGEAGEGTLDFTSDLSMSGYDATELTRSAQGEASLRGMNLKLAIGNLDEKVSRYESSQKFSLVDVGAFLVAGPLGAAATKGYDFARALKGAEGITDISLLVSNWKVEKGVAHAQDVAMATRENRLALKGGLDFVTDSFADVTVSILDEAGCAKVQQKVSGPFSKPKIEEPDMIAALTGPISGLIGRAGRLLGAKCEVVYEGSVQLTRAAGRS